MRSGVVNRGGLTGSLVLENKKNTSLLGAVRLALTLVAIVTASACGGDLENRPTEGGADADSNGGDGDGDTDVDGDADADGDGDGDVDGDGDADAAPDASHLDADVDLDAEVEEPPPLLGAPCTADGYDQWRCLDEDFIDAYGKSYFLQIRWNLWDVNPLATALWVLDGNGNGSFRLEHNALAAQDLLATSSVRSVEIEFLGDDGYWMPPVQGYVAAASMMTELVGSLADRRIADGSWVTYIGVGNAATIAAAALSWHRFDRLVDRFVLVSGPLVSDLRAACTNDYSPEYVPSDRTDIRQMLDVHNGWQEERFCEARSPNAPYEERSVLPAGAQASYPQAHIHMITGDLDSMAPWISRSTELWYRRIEAAGKTRHVFPLSGHDLVSGPPEDEESRYALELLGRFAGRAPSEPDEPMPRISFSLSLDGQETLVLPENVTVYGRVQDTSVNASVCALASVASTACAELPVWQAIYEPWVYDPQLPGFRSQFIPRDLGYLPGTFHAWWRDNDTYAHSDILMYILTNIGN